MKRYLAPEMELWDMQKQWIATVSLELDGDDTDEDGDVSLPFVPFG